MTDYIERAAAVKIAERYGTGNGSVLGRHSGVADVIAATIDAMPAADVAPVVHGRWKQCFEDWRKQIEGDKCSICGFEHYGVSIAHYHYCPNCGAKMGGGANE